MARAVHHSLLVSMRGIGGLLGFWPLPFDVLCHLHAGCRFASESSWLIAHGIMWSAVNASGSYWAAS